MTTDLQTKAPSAPSAETGPKQPTRGLRGVPEAFRVAGIRLVEALCRLLGRRVAGGLLWLFSVHYALFARTARRSSKAYLARIGQEATFGAVVRHLFHFVRVKLDRYLFLGEHTAQLDLECFGGESLRREGTRGAVLLGAHLGSLEAIRAIAEREKVPVNVLVADLRAAERMNGVLARLAPSLNFRLIALDPTRATSMLDVKERIDRGELVAILADRIPDKSDRTVEADFLGAKALFPTGPYLLAHMLHCPVYLVFGLLREPNRYEVYVEPFADAIRLPRATRAEALRTYAQKYADRIEAHARKAPYNWFNFYDFWAEK